MRHRNEHEESRDTDSHRYPGNAVARSHQPTADYKGGIDDLATQLAVYLAMALSNDTPEMVETPEIAGYRQDLQRNNNFAPLWPVETAHQVGGDNSQRHQ